MDDFDELIGDQIDGVYALHPDLHDHRHDHPWLHGWLGDVSSPVWFVAENPSATQVDRIHSATSTPEDQWAASRGDRLFRDTLVEHDLKDGEPMAPGGWRCYITNVMKSEVYVHDWNGTRNEQQLAVAEMWAPVLHFELEHGQPELLIVLGGNAYEAIMHLSRRQLLPDLPPIARLHHYSYVMMRPHRKRGLGPGDPARQTEWRTQLGDAVKNRHR